MSKKGLSFEEKQSRLLAAMLKKGEFFIFKEIEKPASSCGIVPQTTKQVLQALVDDNLVYSDKVGTQNVFWALKSTETSKLENDEKNFRNKLAALRVEISNLDELVQAHENLDPMVIKERARLRESWEEIKKTLVESNAEIEKLELTGPNYVKKLERDVEYARNGISRWTDNLSILRSWVKSRTGLKESELNAQWGIAEDFEEIEEFFV
eukprot:GHVP01047366.1.p1 GENE.GHVP01047366.1~~GHVP01047366.1.p1  ORF type:complete len:209 (-),score=46.45 GHVP01047366.1:1034-1660(-)